MDQISVEKAVAAYCGTGEAFLYCPFAPLPLTCFSSSSTNRLPQRKPLDLAMWVLVGREKVGPWSGEKTYLSLPSYRLEREREVALIWFEEESSVGSKLARLRMYTEIQKNKNIF